MASVSNIITEITPLSEKDCFYLVDRLKDEFAYPIHRHMEYELNFVANCNGARRVVGDSIEELGDFDLVLTGHNIEHAWEQHKCKNEHIREITIQFSNDLFGDVLLAKNQLTTIREMLSRCANGLAFGKITIMRIFNRLEMLSNEESGFRRLLHFMDILYDLSIAEDSYELSSSSFAKVHHANDSRRVRKVQEYIMKNYKDDIRLADLARLAGMTPTAFSRFFKLRTGRTISDYLIEIRLGQATRLLVDTSMSIAEVCYDCGFNNISHFNRIFRRKKGCSPKEFRDTYKRHKLLI